MGLVTWSRAVTRGSCQFRWGDCRHFQLSGPFEKGDIMCEVLIRVGQSFVIGYETYVKLVKDDS